MGKKLFFVILLVFQQNSFAEGTDPANEVFEMRCDEQIFIQCQLNCPTYLQDRAVDVCVNKGFVGANLVRQGRCFRPNPDDSVSMRSTFKCFN